MANIMMDIHQCGVTGGVWKRHAGCKKFVPMEDTNMLKNTSFCIPCFEEFMEKWPDYEDDYEYDEEEYWYDEDGVMHYDGYSSDEDDNEPKEEVHEDKEDKS